MQVLQLTVGIRQYSPLLEVWRKEAVLDGATNVSSVHMITHNINSRKNVCVYCRQIFQSIASKQLES